MLKGRQLLIKYGVAASICLLALTIAFSQRYQIATDVTPRGLLAVYRLDKWTGSVDVCIRPDNVFVSSSGNGEFLRVYGGPPAWCRYANK